MLDSYRLRMAALGSYEGESRRRNAQKIMDASWMRDPATKPVYVKWVDSGLPEINDKDAPVYAKYNVKSYHNITGDAVSYLLQFRLEDMIDNPDIKVGSYVQICNEKNQMEWWLIVHEDDRTQFRQFSILKCTWTYKWISRVNGKRVVKSCLGAPRKQNSYNSGVWLDYTTQTVENQEVMWLPTNDDTKTILYDTRFIKSSEGRHPPIIWKVSKIEDTATDGISKFTMTQEQFNPSEDNADLMIANYYENGMVPDLLEPDNNQTFSNLEITYSGNPTIRAGGGYKKLTLKTRVGEELVDVEGQVGWLINFPEADPAKLETISAGNIFKFRYNDYSLVGSTFDVTATTEYGSKSIVIEVVSL